MASLDTLPPDQRAVIDLVLQRGRTYDDIARLLGIDRAAVRARALAAFEAIGPDTGISPESRALITDYLLGQLPDRVAEQTRERLAGSPYDRAWARVLASELGQVASKPLPEIPDGSRAAAASTAQTTEGERVADGTPSAGASPARSARSTRARDRGSGRPRLSDRPSSRRGGAIVLGVGVLVVVAVVVVLLNVLGGGSSKHPTTTPAASSGTPTSPSSTTSTSGGATSTSGTGSTSGTTPQAQVVGQSNLNPPGGKGQAKAVAFMVKEGSAYGIVVEASNVAPNSHNAYAAWLYNSPTDAYRLGFVNPPVGKNGKLEVGSPLPTNASHYKQLLLTLETQSNPKSPGTIVLQGPFSLTSTTG